MANDRHNSSVHEHDNNMITRLLAILLFILIWQPAKAVTCNVPGGFIVTFGTYNIGDFAIFSPDCGHLQGSSSGIPGLTTGTGAFVLQNTPTIITPNIQNGLTWSTSGVNNFTISTTASPIAATTWQAIGNGQTMSILLNPGSGTLATGTITEFNAEATLLQAFGGDYRRCSFGSSGTGQGNSSGIICENGGVPGTTLGPYFIENAIENPPGTFTNTQFFFLTRVAGAGLDQNLGAILTNLGSTPINSPVYETLALGSAGFIDSNRPMWVAQANDGSTARAVYYRGYAHPTVNNGTSRWVLDTNLNGAGFFDVLQITDSGHATIGIKAPTVTSCGTLPSVIGTDAAGEITTGSSATTSCVLTFNTTFIDNKPFCNVTLEASNAGPVWAVPTLTNLTINYASATSLKIMYSCLGS